MGMTLAGAGVKRAPNLAVEFELIAISRKVQAASRKLQAASSW